MKLTKEEINKDNIFCLIGSFIARVNHNEWCLIDIKNKVIVPKKYKHIILLDRAINRIAEELNKIYTVKEK